jgi:hypothetical protein
MTARHTPGPWDYEQSLRGDGVPIPYSWQVLAEIAPPPGVDEAFMHVADCETEANARLIAAAPDLLAALRECITDDGAAALASDDPEMMRRRLAAINRVCRAAIAQAEGGAA